MNSYPNYNSLNTFFFENFNDYDKFVKTLEKIEYNDNITVFDFKNTNNINLNQTYNAKKLYETANFIIDSYFNLYIKSRNMLYIHNYVNFPEYVLYLINETINRIISDVDDDVDVDGIDDFINKLKEISDKALSLLKLTKYIIINFNSNNKEDDIEDMTYLKNRLEEYKFKLSELEYVTIKKDHKIDDQNKIISELKLKNRKANFTLMENQNLFSELHVEVFEKVQDIDKQKEEIDKHKEEINKQKEEINKQKEEIDKQKEEINKQKEEINKQKEEIDKQKEEIDKQKEEINKQKSTFLNNIYDGFYVLFSRIHF
jgi:hypothetical protein